jgi:lipopolysaccharide transport system ATP-binding protein
MSEDIAVSVQNVSKRYLLYDRPQDRLKQSLLWRFGKSYAREFWALRDVSFDVKKGETVGIIGRNGSGKSTLLQIIAGTLQPTNGEVQANGRVAALLELGSGFNPEFTGRENVYLNGAILGFNRQRMDERFDEIAAFADIGQFMDQPVKLYSSGMFVRLAFAVQTCVEPAVLIVDEVLAVGDIVFQARCLDQIDKLRKSGTTTLLVTHDINTFQNLCDYGYLLHEGCVFSQGQPSRVASQYYEMMRQSEHTRQRLTAASSSQPEQILEEARIKEDEVRNKTDPGEYRFGTSAARIVDFRVVSSTGEAVSAFEVGEKFSVSVQVECYNRVKNLALGIMFRNSQGQNLMGMHTFHDNKIQLGPYDSGDRIDISCEQKMLLNPGDYLLHLAVADCHSVHEFVTLDYRDNLAKVSVFGEEFPYGIVHTEPRFTWKEHTASSSSYHSLPDYDPIVFGYSLEQVKGVWEAELDNPDLQRTVQTILEYDDDNLKEMAIPRENERGWPGESRFALNGYYRMMLGRYVFAGSQFCQRASVLDTCCGFGWGAFLISHYADRVTAFDIDPGAIHVCETEWPAENINWLVGDARDLSFLQGRLYDVVLGMETIEHFDQSDGARYVQEVARVLRPGGIFTGTTAVAETRQEAQEIQCTNRDHLHIFTRQELLDLLGRYFSRSVIIGKWLFIGER